MLLGCKQGGEVQLIHVHCGALLEWLLASGSCCNAETAPLSAFPDQHDRLLLKQLVSGVVRVERYEHAGRLRAVLDLSLGSHHILAQRLRLHLVFKLMPLRQ